MTNPALQSVQSITALVLIGALLALGYRAFAQRFTWRPRNRDGITEPENDYGDFGEERLAQIVQEDRELPLPRISDAILNAVLGWIGGEEQPDDMTIVLARPR